MLFCGQWVMPQALSKHCSSIERNKKLNSIKQVFWMFKDNKHNGLILVTREKQSNCDFVDLSFMSKLQGIGSSYAELQEFLVTTNSTLKF